MVSFLKIDRLRTMATAASTHRTESRAMHTSPRAMARRVRQESFADLVKEPTWSQTRSSSRGQQAPMPGRFNRIGTPSIRRQTRPKL